MRIKFNKGMTPEDIANMFVRVVNERNNIVGTVNIYFQEHDENLKQVKDEDYIEVRPTEYGLNRYNEYAAELRRDNLKVV